MGLVELKVKGKKVPRNFSVGLNKQITIKDCGTIQLERDEQITFVTDSGKEYDVARKDWGFYATPSINGRLKGFGFKTALVKNTKGKYYIMLVEKEKLSYFKNYLKEERQTLEYWLDETK